MASENRSTRLSYEESCVFLQRLGYPDAGSDGEILPMPDRLPQCDDDELEVSFFRTIVEDGDLENLTLPRTFFGKSKVGPISFKNTDFRSQTFAGMISTMSILKTPIYLKRSPWLEL